LSTEESQSKDIDRHLQMRYENNQVRNPGTSLYLPLFAELLHFLYGDELIWLEEA